MTAKMLIISISDMAYQHLKEKAAGSGKYLDALFRDLAGNISCPGGSSATIDGFITDSVMGAAIAGADKRYYD